ncbi:EF hand domain-containing protein [Ditylenchus destructor]|uniref:EF hand domain-containing protein n=1 Tax=Ditylenchus destructor TaxID=166010 RepID=A0AAD4NFT5_9BILA|nr:EF hand domain-containing protein [Ditylenchus destructor]
MAASYICRRYILNDAELSDTFDLLDMDRDGRLNRQEIGALLRAVNMEPTRKELDFIFSEMDRDQSGKINKESFVNYLRSPPINRITIGELEKHFKEFDSDGDGAITEDELSKILEKMADLHDPDVISELFRATDTNGRGRISFHEFIKMMTE